MARKIVEEGLIKLTTSIRHDFEADEEWQEISGKGYPTATATKGHENDKGKDNSCKKNKGFPVPASQNGSVEAGVDA